MTLKGECRNPQYISFVEAVVNKAEESVQRMAMYSLVHIIVREMAFQYTDQEIIRIIENVRKSAEVKNS